MPVFYYLLSMGLGLVLVPNGSVEYHLTMNIALVGYLIGYLFSYRLYRNQRPLVETGSKVDFYNHILTSISLKTLSWLLVLSSLAAVMGISNALQKGVSFGGRLWEYTFAFWSPVTYMYFLSGLALIVTALRYRALTAANEKLLRKRSRKFVVVCGLLACVLCFLHGVRGTVIFPMFLSLLVFFDNRVPRYRLLSISIFIGVALFSFLFISEFRDGFQFREDFITHLTRVLKYFQPNFENFDNLLSKDFDHTFGLGIFSSLLRPLVFIFSFGTIDKMAWYSLITDIGVSHGSFWAIDDRYVKINFFGPVFVDFGYPGIILVSILLGFFSASVYITRFKSLLRYFLFLLLCFQSAFVFWGFELIRTQFIFWFLVLWFINLRLVRCK